MNQGRTPEDQQDSAEICTLCLIGAIICVVVACISSAFAEENAFTRLALVVDLTPEPAIGNSLAIASDGPASTAHGYGVPIAYDGKDTLIITARHVIAEEGNGLRPSRVCIDGKWFDLSPVKDSPRLDLALLRLHNQHIPIFPIAQSPVLKELATQQTIYIHLPGAVCGTHGSASGRGVFTERNELFALVFRFASVNGVPVYGETTCASASTLRGFLEGK